MFSIAGKGYLNRIWVRVVVYRLEAAAHRYVLKGNTATAGIYCDSGPQKMAFWMQ